MKFLENIRRFLSHQSTLHFTTRGCIPFTSFKSFSYNDKMLSSSSRECFIRHSRSSSFFEVFWHNFSRDGNVEYFRRETIESIKWRLLVRLRRLETWDDDELSENSSNTQAGAGKETKSCCQYCIVQSFMHWIRETCQSSLKLNILAAELLALWQQFIFCHLPLSKTNKTCKLLERRRTTKTNLQKL